MNIKEIKKELKNPGHLLMRINHRYPWMFKWMPDEICLKFWCNTNLFFLKKKKKKI